MDSPRQIFAFSGMLETTGDQRTNADLTRFALDLTPGHGCQRVCYVPTAVGDSPVAIQAKTKEFAREHPNVHLSTLSLFPQPSVDDVRGHLMAQDLILVEGEASRTWPCGASTTFPRS